MYLRSSVLSVPAHTRQKPGLKPIPDNLPRIEVIHDLSEEEKLCNCGCQMSKIGEEVSEKLDIIPAKIVGPASKKSKTLEGGPHIYGGVYLSIWLNL